MNLTVKIASQVGFLMILCFTTYKGNEVCDASGQDSCDSYIQENQSKYSKGANQKWGSQLQKIQDAVKNYEPCNQENCTCYLPTIENDFAVFKSGIRKEMIDSARSRGTKYQIINHTLYREAECMFPARCSGVEYFILKIIHELPDVEFILNSRDWPQFSKHFNNPTPVFSFSKTMEYYDILYPAWSFWKGGPAIKLYPRGIGRWDLQRKSLAKQAELWPWHRKRKWAFFRGSRTSNVRDPLILLSRERPGLVDAQYTKNQAWKSESDTLNAPPADEVLIEEHCRYQYLFNFRGVAASFRFKHLFLCGSLVFHGGEEWIEFFYPAMQPWVHYIPVKTGASKEELRELIEFAMENDEVAQEIAERGHQFIKDHLQMSDIFCYWKELLKRYRKLLKFKPTLDRTLIQITSHS